MPQEMSNAQQRLTVWLRNCFVLIDDTCRLISMTFLSIVALNMVDRISKTILFMCERCLSACTRMRCMLIHLNAFSVLKRFPS